MSLQVPSTGVSSCVSASLDLDSNSRETKRAARRGSFSSSTYKVTPESRYNLKVADVALIGLCGLPTVFFAYASLRLTMLYHQVSILGGVARTAAIFVPTFFVLLKGANKVGNYVVEQRKKVWVESCLESLGVEAKTVVWKRDFVDMGEKISLVSALMITLVAIKVIQLPARYGFKHASHLVVATVALGLLYGITLFFGSLSAIVIEGIQRQYKESRCCN